MLELTEILSMYITNLISNKGLPWWTPTHRKHIRTYNRGGTFTLVVQALN